jgi:peptide-methionine (R)-S-oxide reductase
MKQLLIFMLMQTQMQIEQVLSFTPIHLVTNVHVIHSLKRPVSGLDNSNNDSNGPNSNHDDDSNGPNSLNDWECACECSRRVCLQKAIVGITSSTTLIPLSPRVASARTNTNTNTEEKAAILTFQKGKSRSENYEVRRSNSEWTTLLSTAQLNVLRRGQTERQRSSILEKEKRDGSFLCAGCNQPLFSSDAKFDSGTGWPSFDSPIITMSSDSDNNASVEIEEVGWVQSLDGAEVRCQTCGSHLGDVFTDGWRYGSKTGKRYCINGAALIFHPMDGGKDVRGDIPPPNKVIQY